MSMDLLEILAGKWQDGTRPKDLYAERISKDPEAFVDVLIKGLGHRRRKVQSGCAELVSLLSEEHPELFAPHIDLFIANLEAKAPVLRWEAVCTLGNLASVDSSGKLPAQIPALTILLPHESIVLRNHAVHALAKIAKAYPEKAPEIQQDLIEVRDHFPRNKIGFLIEVMDAFMGDEVLRQKARAFVTPYLKSEIKVVATKAKRMLAKLDEG